MAPADAVARRLPLRARDVRRSRRARHEDDDVPVRRSGRDRSGTSDGGDDDARRGVAVAVAARERASARAETRDLGAGARARVEDDVARSIVSRAIRRDGAGARGGRASSSDDAASNRAVLRQRWTSRSRSRSPRTGRDSSFRTAARRGRRRDARRADPHGIARRGRAHRSRARVASSSRAGSIARGAASDEREREW